MKITAREGSTVDMTISGATQAVSGSKWDMRNEVWKPEHDHPRGVVTRMYGSAAFDLESGTFTRFDLVALGRRYGFSENNGRKCQIEPSSIGYSLSFAPTGMAHRVPPTFIDVYDAKWLVRPKPAAANAGK
ncbi:MAG: hypothetical protein IPK83_23465 [Planctomycetes bacterium]|nr:hypothetical protein [Planctomycetota bacterium]